MFKLSIKKAALFIGLSFFIFISFPNIAQARTDYYKNVKVDYEINEDSSVSVRETFEIFYDGIYRGTNRSIELIDSAALKQCKSNSQLTCAGFDFITIDRVWSEKGELIEGEDYELLTYDYTDGSREIDIRYEHSPAGYDFNSETFTWGIEYTAYGSLGYFADYDLFYWDTIFADRTVDIENAEVNINYPKNLVVNPDIDLRVFRDATYEQSEGRLTLYAENLYPGDPFTVLLKLEKGVINDPVSLNINTFLFGFNLQFLSDYIDYKIDGVKIVNNGGQFTGLRTGPQVIEVSSDLFVSDKLNINGSSGETLEIDLSLSPSPLFIIIFGAVLVSWTFGLFMVVFGFFYPIYRWYRHGRDKGIKKSIIPIFKPTNDNTPAVLGALIDERVTPLETTATLVNIAYKGYIKIIDEGSRNYKFVKLKEFDDLPNEEKFIIEKIFGSKKEVTTNSLKNSFYSKLPSIEKTIEDKILSEGYFLNRPSTVRSGNLGCGGALVFLAAVVGGFLISISPELFLFFGILPLLGLIILGVNTLILGNFMPAKTERGTLALQQTEGFKMYLKTAERFRLQNLTPDLFEKYLAYALVFGVVNDWAKNFEGIYTESPSWYEGKNLDTFDIYVFSRAMSSFSNSTSSIVSSRPSSSGSSSGGSGWSGGGGFSGGFSGGGSGGGGGGSW